MQGAVNFRYKIAEHCWNSQARRSKETSQFSLILSTYTQTNELQMAGTCTIAPSDVMVQVKLKSSAFRPPVGKNQVKSLSYDAWGFQTPLPCFVGMLRSVNFAKVLDHARHLATLVGGGVQEAEATAETSVGTVEVHGEEGSSGSGADESPGKEPDPLRKRAPPTDAEATQGEPASKEAKKT